MASIASGLGPPGSDSDDMCSYFGKRIYRDILRCPHCGNTDGQGPLAGKAKRHRFRFGWPELLAVIVVAILVLVGVVGMIMFFVNRQ